MRQKLVRWRTSAIALGFALVASLSVLLPLMQQHVFAQGEAYYIESASVNTATIHVQGGALATPAALTENCGLNHATTDACFFATITVRGTVARQLTNTYKGDPRITRDQDTCDYWFFVTVSKSDLTNLKIKAPGISAVQATGYDSGFGLQNGSVGGYSNGDHGAVGDCKSGTDVIGALSQPPEIPVLSAADIAASAQCTNQGGIYDTVAKKCNLPSCPQLPGGANGVYVPATKNCAYLLSQFPDGKCPAGTTPGTYTSTTGATNAAPQPACFGAATAPTAAGGVNSVEPDVCPIQPNTPLRWLVCPLVIAGNALASQLDGIIDGYLKSGNEIFQDKNGADQNGGFSNGYHSAWATFRTLGIGLVVIAGLFMLVSEALGLQLLDAYTVKKVAPRLFIAVIAIAMSWDLAQFVVGAFDDLGHAAGSAVFSAFGQQPDGANGANVSGVIIAQLTATGLIAAKLAALGPGGILSLLGSLILAMLIGFMVLIARQAIITACVLLSPLAIAAYILPNTSKFAKFWWDTFIRMLMLYPIATGIIALCKVLGTLTVKSSKPFATVAGILFFFAGYALLPATFRLAGGAVATLGGIANDRSKGIFDSRRKKRQEIEGERKQRFADRRLMRRENFASNLQDKANQSTRSRFGRSALMLGSRVAAGSHDIQEQMSARRAAVMKRVADIKATGKDGTLRGGSVDVAAADADWANVSGRSIDSEGNTVSANKRRRVTKDDQIQYRSLGGAWVNGSDVAESQRLFGKDNFAQQAILQYEIEKASTPDELEYLAQNYKSLASKQWRTGGGGAGRTSNLSEGQIEGIWKGATYATQNKNLRLKHTSSDGKLKYKPFTSEIYENKGSYSMANMSAHTVKGLQESWVNAVNTGDVAEQQKLAAIAETFVHDVGMGGASTIPGDDGAQIPITAPGTGIRGAGRQASTPGAASVAEQVREFASMTGVLAKAPNAPTPINPAPPPGTPSQRG